MHVDRFYADRGLIVMLIGVEIRQFFTDRRNLQVLPLIVVGIPLALYPYLPSPFVMVFGVMFAALEAQYNNILYRTSREFELLTILPVRWQSVIIAKNLSTGVLSVFMTGVVASVLLYFVPNPPDAGDVGQAVLYLTTVLFPLAHAGNQRSLQRPRRNAGWTLDDLVEACVMLVVVLVLSIPYFILRALPGSAALCILYAAGTAVVWLSKSVPSTAARIEQETDRLCQAA